MTVRGNVGTVRGRRTNLANRATRTSFAIEWERSVNNKVARSSERIAR